MFIKEQVKLFNKAAACAILIGAALRKGNNEFLARGNMDFFTEKKIVNSSKIALPCDFSRAENRRLVDQFVVPAAKSALAELESLEEGAIIRQNLPDVPFTADILYVIDNYPHVHVE